MGYSVVNRFKLWIIILNFGLSLLIHRSSYAMSDINHVHAFAGTGRVLNTDFAYLGPHLESSGLLFFQYLNQPLKPISLGMDKQGVPFFSEQVDHRVDMQLSLSIALFRRLQIALLFPVTLVQSGLFYGRFALSSPYYRYQSLQSTPNDFHLFFKVIIAENTTKKASQDLTAGIAGTFDISIFPGVPTINDGVPYAQGFSDYSSPNLYPQILLRSKIVGHMQYRWLTVGANLGIRIHPFEQGPEDSLPWHSLIREIPSQSWSKITNMVAISYSLGVQANIFNLNQKVDFFLFTDFFGLSHLIDGQSSPIQRALSNPLELAIGGKAILWKQLTLLLGASVAVTQGYGAVTMRLFFSANWSYAFKGKGS